MSDLAKELEVMAANITTMADAYLASKLKQSAARIEALEAGLKPFAEAHKAVSRSIANGRYGNSMSTYVHDDDWKRAASLLEPKT